VEAGEELSEIGTILDPVQKNTPIELHDGTTITPTVVALLHPARNAGTQHRRRARYQVAVPESVMLDNAWIGTTR
jgi:hypothetical protein